MTVSISKKKPILKQMSGSMKYDPAALRKYAKHKYESAKNRKATMAVIGVIFGSAFSFGLFKLLLIKNAAFGTSVLFKNTTMFTGAVAGGAYGYQEGKASIEELHGEAQHALCLAELEKSMRIVRTEQESEETLETPLQKKAA